MPAVTIALPSLILVLTESEFTSRISYEYLPGLIVDVIEDPKEIDNLPKDLLTNETTKLAVVFDDAELFFIAAYAA